jgi:hypothetical protein
MHVKEQTNNVWGNQKKDLFQNNTMNCIMENFGMLTIGLNIQQNNYILYDTQETLRIETFVLRI